MCFKAYKNLIKLYKSVVWAKTIGLIFSLLLVFGIVLLVDNYQNYSLFIWGMFFWYPTVGALVALMGIMDYHPILRMKMYLWRGALVGGWMNSLLILFAYDKVIALASDFGLNWPGSVVMLIVILEGIAVGILIDYVITRQFGEGKSLMER